jgi:uncharacterized RDD family membrane protein YckC
MHLMQAHHVLGAPRWLQLLRLPVVLAVCHLSMTLPSRVWHLRICMLQVYQLSIPMRVLRRVLMVLGAGATYLLLLRQLLQPPRAQTLHQLLGH